MAQSLFRPSKKQVPFGALRLLRAGSHRAFGTVRNDIQHLCVAFSGKTGLRE